MNTELILAGFLLARFLFIFQNEEIRKYFGNFKILIFISPGLRVLMQIAV